LDSSFEVIKSRILAKGQQEAEKIIAEAQKKAEEIVATAQRTSDEIVTEKIMPQIAITRRRILASARLKGRTLMLQTKNEAIDKVFKLCEERLRNVAAGTDRQHNYQELLIKLLCEAARRLEEHNLVITSDQNTLTYLKNNTKQIEATMTKNLGSQVNLKIENSPYDCIGGVVVRNSNSTKTFYNTLDGRLLTIKQTLTGRVADILFT